MCPCGVVIRYATKLRSRQAYHRYNGRCDLRDARPEQTAEQLQDAEGGQTTQLCIFLPDL
eukprot:4419436-Amphidinium_carterae.1